MISSCLFFICFTSCFFLFFFFFFFFVLFFSNFCLWRAFSFFFFFPSPSPCLFFFFFIFFFFFKFSFSLVCSFFPRVLLRVILPHNLLFLSFIFFVFFFLFTFFFLLFLLPSRSSSFILQLIVIHSLGFSSHYAPSSSCFFSLL